MPDLVDRSALRVCADPANMPFSNDKGQGFENKIADLLASKLKVAVVYTWFPQAVGFVRNTLGARKCDLVIGFPQGDELVQNTNAYYRSAYALVTRADSPLAGVETLADPRLKGKSIGVIARTPPATSMAANGLLATAKSFQLVVDRRHSSPAEEMIAAVAVESSRPGFCGARSAATTRGSARCRCRLYRSSRSPRGRAWSSGSPWVSDRASRSGSTS